MFTHLRIQTHYSFLSSIVKIPDLLSAISEQGGEAVGIMDRNGLYGALDFYESCKKKGLKAIIGSQLNTATAYTPTGHKQLPFTPTGLIARNLAGRNNLVHLVSQAQRHIIGEQPTILRSDIMKQADGLIFFTGLPSGYLGSLITSGNTDQREQCITQAQQINGTGHIFAEIIAQSPTAYPGISEYNQKIIALAQTHGLPLIATTPVSYLKPEHQEAYHIASCIKQGVKRADTNKQLSQRDGSLLTAEQMKNNLLSQGLHESIIDQAIAQTQDVVDQCELSLSLTKTFFPLYQSDPRIEAMYHEHKHNMIIPM